MLKFNVSYKTQVGLNARKEFIANDLTLVSFRKLAAELLRDDRVENDTIKVETFTDHEGATKNIQDMLSVWIASQHNHEGDIDNILVLQAMAIYFEEYIGNVMRERKGVTELHVEHITPGMKIVIGEDVAQVVLDNLEERDEMRRTNEVREALRS